MTTTRYTNTVLTIIALCLLALAGRELVTGRSASAEIAGPQRVVIVGWQWDGKGLPVDIKNAAVLVSNGGEPPGDSGRR
jgi:hypothetical protein